MLAAAFLLTGCSGTSSAPAPAESAVTAQTTAADSQSAEAAPADTAAENVTEATETSAETGAAGYEFNAHLYLPILADDVPQEYWDSFHNLCDALRAGEATFECASEDAYKWATDPAVLNQLFPAAVMQIKAESDDGTPVYENGTGRIIYQIPAEEFAKRQAQFEKLVADLLNQYLEPETFFESHTQAVSTVSEVIAGGESAIQSAVASVSNKLAVISKAFEANIRAQMFQRLGINTLADYLDQTIWQAVFNVLAFLLCFIALYVLVCLVVNLLDHVISFPVVRGFDWLLGGLFGLARGLVVVVLVLCLVPAIVQIVSPEFADSLRTGSVLYSYVMQMDFLNVNKLVTSLVGG